MNAEMKQIEKQKLGFLGNGLHTQEQDCVSIIKFAYAGSCPKTQKTQKQGRTSKRKF